MRLKRAILLVSTALLAGAVINVGVAWWCLSRVNLIRLMVWAGVSTSRPWPDFVPEEWPPPSSLDEWFATGIASRSFRLWGHDNAFEWSYDAAAFEIGWPLRCLVERRASCGSSFVLLADQSAPRWSSRWKESVISFGEQVDLGWAASGLRLPATVREQLPGNLAFGTLPIRPLWPGFAINTLLYAAAASAPFALFVTVRRWRRRAHFQCPACAYDLRGLAPSTPCPECGAARV